MPDPVRRCVAVASSVSLWALAGLSWPVSAQTVAPGAVNGAIAADPTRAEPAVRVEHDKSGVQVITLPRAVALKGVQGCTSATTLRIKTSTGRANPAEPALVDIALRTGKPLLIAEAKCAEAGVVQGSSIALEPEAVAVDWCQLPTPQGRPPGCPR